MIEQVRSRVKHAGIRSHDLHRIMHFPIMIPHVRKPQFLHVSHNSRVPKLPCPELRPHRLRKNGVAGMLRPWLPGRLPVLPAHPDHNMHRKRLPKFPVLLQAPAGEVVQRAKPFVAVDVSPER
nr:hypothetical protein MtrunA17_Chr4g0043031 [Ipomoea trifida]